MTREGLKLFFAGVTQETVALPEHAAPAATRAFECLGVPLSPAPADFHANLSFDAGRAVAGLGAGGREAALLYGALTQRSVTVFETTEDLFHWLAVDPPSESLFVFVDEQLQTLEFSGVLITASLELSLPVGILPVSASVASAMHAASRLVALRLRPSRYPRRTAVFSDHLADLERIPADADGFSPNDARNLIHSLRSGTKAAVFLAHSNGIDFRIGDHILCVQADDLRPSLGLPNENFFPCQAGGRCQRERFSSVALVGAQSIRAPIAVFLSCSSAPLAGGLINPRFAFTSALFRGDDTQAVVCSFSVSTPPSDYASTVARLLSAGSTLGQIALCVNEVMPSFPSYLCVGDPELTVATAAPRADALPESTDFSFEAHGVFAEAAGEKPRNRSVIPASRLIDAKPGARQCQSQLQGDAFKSTADSASARDPLSPDSALLAGLVRNLFKDEPSDTMRGLSDLLSRQLDALAKPEDLTSEHERLLCRYLAHYVSTGVYINRFWRTYCWLEPLRMAGLRHQPCSKPIGVARVRHAAFGTGYARNLWYCSRCGFIGDSPATMFLPQLTWSQGHVRCTLPDEVGSAWVASSVEAIGNGLELPQEPQWIAGSNAIYKTFAKPTESEAGVRWYSVVSVQQGTYCHTRVPIDISRVA